MSSVYGTNGSQYVTLFGNYEIHLHTQRLAPIPSYDQDNYRNSGRYLRDAGVG